MPKAKPLPPHESRCPVCTPPGPLRFRRRGKDETAMLTGFVIGLVGVALMVVLPVTADQLVAHPSARTPTMLVGIAAGVAVVAFAIYHALYGRWAWRCDTCAYTQRWEKLNPPAPPPRPARDIVTVTRPAEVAPVLPPLQGAMVQAFTAQGQPIIVVMPPQQPAHRPGHCPRCNAAMQYFRGSPSGGTVLVGVIGMVLGILLCLTGLGGCAIGAPLLIISAILGSIGEKRLKCPACLQ